MYVVVDTNVIVSSMVAHDDSSPMVGVLASIYRGDIVPIYGDYLINEYLDVISRPIFSIPKEWISDVIDGIIESGLFVQPDIFYDDLPDEKDIPIYSLVMSTRSFDSYLITGNIKHFPKKDYIITPREAMDKLRSNSVFYIGN